MFNPLKYCTQSRNDLLRERFFLLLFGFIVISAGLGLRDPWPADEPRFALIAKEMVETGQWFFPHRAGELYSDKPPVFMWSIAVFYKLTHSIRLSFLLPSLIAALITLYTVYDLASRCWNRRIGLIAGIALLTTMQFQLQGKTGQIDALFCMWTTLGLYGLIRHLALGPNWKWYYLAFAAMGFGILTKLIGFLPMALFLPYVIVKLRRWPSVPKFKSRWWQWALGPVVMLCVAGSWFLAMIILTSVSGDPQLIEYRNDILFHQTAGRYLNAWGHIKPIWYYVLNVLPFFWLPVVLLVPWMLPNWWRRLCRKDITQLLLLSYVVFILLFFTLSAGKRGVYVFPALPAFILAASPLMPGLFKKLGVHRLARITLLVFSLLLIGALIVLGASDPILEKMMTKYSFDPRSILMVLGVVSLGWLAFSFKKRAIVGIAGFFLSIWLVYGWWGYVKLNPVRSEALFMQKIAEIIKPTSELAMLGWREQHILFADRKVVTFGYHRTLNKKELENAVQWLRAGDNRWILVRENRLAPCFSRDSATQLGWRYPSNWFLIQSHAIKPACLSFI